MCDVMNACKHLTIRLCIDGSYFLHTCLCATYSSTNVSYVSRHSQDCMHLEDTRLKGEFIVGGCTFGLTW